MEPAASNPLAGKPSARSVPCHVACLRLLLFTLLTAVLAGLLSWLFLPWLNLPWWKVFRRCASVSAALSLVGMLRFIDRQPFRMLGLGPWSQGRSDLSRGLLLGMSTVAVVGSLYALFGACRISVHPDSWRVWRTVIGFLPAALLVAVLEELIFRGYVFHQLLAWSASWAVMGSSLAYALVHLRGGFVWPATAFELIGLWILGVVLAVSRLRTGQLYLAIGLHASLAYWARVNKLLIAFQDSTIPWLIGTNRLVNGVAAWVALGVIGWIITRWRACPNEGGGS